MGDIVSLREFRKKKALRDKDVKAAENRVRHGRTRDQRDRDRRESERTVEQLDGKKLGGGAVIPVVEGRRPDSPAPTPPKADDA